MDEISDHVKCSTTKGDILIEIYRTWAPLGADRFMELVRDGFFQEIAFYRCVSKFLTQFGISDKPEYKHWHWKQIPDDPNLRKGIHKNYLSFAGGGPNTRSTQLFIAFEDLDFLGNEPWETPFGKVVEGQETLDALFKGYGDMPPFGKGPNQQKIFNRGNAYLREEFPSIDYIQSCSVIEEDVASSVEIQQTQSKDSPTERSNQHLSLSSTEAAKDREIERDLSPQPLSSGNGFLSSSETTHHSPEISHQLRIDPRRRDWLNQARNDVVSNPYATSAGAVFVMMVLFGVLWYFHTRRKATSVKNY